MINATRLSAFHALLNATLSNLRYLCALVAFCLQLSAKEQQNSFSVSGVIAVEGRQPSTNLFSAQFRGSQYRIVLKYPNEETICTSTSDGVDSFSVFTGFEMSLGSTNYLKVVISPDPYPWLASDFIQVIWMAFAPQSDLIAASLKPTNGVVLSHLLWEEDLPWSSMRLEVVKRASGSHPAAGINVYAPNYIALTEEEVRRDIPKLLGTLSTNGQGLLKVPLTYVGTNGYLLLSLSSPILIEGLAIPKRFSLSRFTSPNPRNSVMALRTYRGEVTSHENNLSAENSQEFPDYGIVEDYRFRGVYAPPSKYIRERQTGGWIKRGTTEYIAMNRRITAIDAPNKREKTSILQLMAVLSIAAAPWFIYKFSRKTNKQ